MGSWYGPGAGPPVRQQREEIPLWYVPSSEGEQKEFETLRKDIRDYLVSCAKGAVNHAKLMRLMDDAGIPTVDYHKFGFHTLNELLYHCKDFIEIRKYRPSLVPDCRIRYIFLKQGAIPASGQHVLDMVQKQAGEKRKKNGLPAATLKNTVPVPAESLVPHRRQLLGNDGLDGATGGYGFLASPGSGPGASYGGGSGYGSGPFPNGYSGPPVNRSSSNASAYRGGGHSNGYHSGRGGYRHPSSSHHTPRAYQSGRLGSAAGPRPHYPHNHGSSTNMTPQRLPPPLLPGLGQGQLRPPQPLSNQTVDLYSGSVPRQPQQRPVPESPLESVLARTRPVLQEIRQQLVHYLPPSAPARAQAGSRPEPAKEKPKATTTFEAPVKPIVPAAPAVVKPIVQAAPAVVKPIVPAAPALVKPNDPAAPALVKPNASASPALPIAPATPALVKPIAPATPALVKPNVPASPALVKPNAPAAPALVKPNVPPAPRPVQPTVHASPKPKTMSISSNIKFQAKTTKKFCRPPVRAFSVCTLEEFPQGPSLSPVPVMSQAKLDTMGKQIMKLLHGTKSSSSRPAKKRPTTGPTVDIKKATMEIRSWLKINHY